MIPKFHFTFRHFPSVSREFYAFQPNDIVDIKDPTALSNLYRPIANSRITYTRILTLTLTPEQSGKYKTQFILFSFLLSFAPKAKQVKLKNMGGIMAFRNDHPRFVKGKESGSIKE